MDKFNEFQETAKKVYCNGDYAHTRTLEGTDEVGDTLFAFIMYELSTEEGCENLHEAVGRLNIAISDIGKVADAIISQGS